MDSQDTLTPPTNGSIILQTNLGDLEIELFADQTPLACRNFIQLCLEGYYRKCEFFRLVKSFMIQTGDPTNTGSGGLSVYDSTFNDEFHQKLKFNTRGLLGMANNGKNNNGSQFFITFDKCNYLDYKHTLFGRVVGNTIYNLLEMEKIETDASDRPKQVIYITGCKVIVNPFDDILVRQVIQENKHNDQEEKRTLIKQKQLKNRKNRNLLSFQEDEEIQVQLNTSNKVMSSHDVLNDKRLAKTKAIDNSQFTKSQNEQNQKLNTLDQIKKKIKQNEFQQDSLIESNAIKKKEEFLKKQQQIKEQEEQTPNPNPETNKLLKNMKKRLNKRSGKQELYWSSSSNHSQYSSTSSEDYDDQQQKQQRETQKEEYDNLKIELLQFKRDKQGTNNQQQHERRDEEVKLLSRLEQTRLKYVMQSQQKSKDTDVIKRLEGFRQKLNSEEVTGNESHWMNNRLRFHVDSANAYQHFNTKQQANQGTINIDEQPDQQIYQQKEQIPQRDQQMNRKALDSLIEMSEI